MNSDRLDAAGLLARFAALHPVAATATGIHDHDGEWDGFGAAADARVLAWVDEEAARLRSIPEGALDQDDLADRDLALATLAGIRFERTEIRTTAWEGHVQIHADMNMEQQAPHVAPTVIPEEDICPF